MKRIYSLYICINEENFPCYYCTYHIIAPRYHRIAGKLVQGYDGAATGTTYTTC